MPNGEWLHEELQSLRAEMQQSFRDLKGDMRDMREGLKDSLDDHEARLNSHSKRIRSLEAWRYWLAGALAIVAGIFGVLANRIVAVLAAAGR